MNKRARRIIIGTAAFLLGSAISMGCSIIGAPPVCHEDMECWDCETMGNEICGPIEVSVVDRGDGTSYCIVENNGVTLGVDATC